MKYLLIIFALLLAPATTSAHAGDHALQAVSHYATSLFHVFPIAGITGIAAYLISKKIFSKK